MRSSFLLTVTLLGAALLTMGTQCDKDDYLPPLKPSYEFAEKLTLTPYKKVYGIGDTIWVQFLAPDRKLYDQLSNTRVAMDTSTLRMAMQYQKHDASGAEGEFFTSIKLENALDTTFRTLYLRYNILNFRTDCNNPYFFRVAFIPKKTGVYTIEPGGALSPCPGRWTWQHSTFRLTFDLADCNKDVYLALPPYTRGDENGHIAVGLDKKEKFAFKVE